MANSFFADIISPQFNPAAVLDLTGGGGRALIISDFHMGAGPRDDLQPNGGIVLRMLEDYYYRAGWTLVLNGDIEELAKYSLREIRAAWPEMYRVFDLFARDRKLYKTLGNHDERLIFEKDYPYPLYNALRIETPHLLFYVYHGHQPSRVYTDFNSLVRLSLRYLLKPVGIRNMRSIRSPHHRFHVEQAAYNFSLKNRCASIIGHTHRTLFESLSRFDFIKFEIERLCRDYPASRGEARDRIAREVENLCRELGKLKRSERRDGLRHSLYGDELPVPCLFNAGSAIGKKGVNAIELSGEGIALVYWFVQGKEMKFVRRGWYQVEPLGSTGYGRVVLNQDRLEYVKARIELLGRSFSQAPG